MDVPDLARCLASRPAQLRKGPIMVILAEDAVELDSTVAHHLALGFRTVLVLSHTGIQATGGLSARFDGPLHVAVTKVAQAVPEGTWIGHAYNGEYLFFPFCEQRHVGEMLAFHVEERRAAMFGMVVDLYATDLAQSPNGVDRATACYDALGYYALNREDSENGYAPLPRQIDLYGGLRWRFEEHVPWKKRRIDRVMLFRAAKTLEMREDYTLNLPELNTHQCEWHHSLTCCMASFRTAKALMGRPGSRARITGFTWPGSATFGWTGQELMERGFMEPGQWF